MLIYRTSLMGVCLMKTHIRVTIAVLDIDYLVTDNIGTVGKC